jgi:hypothetical protein
MAAERPSSACIGGKSKAQVKTFSYGNPKVSFAAAGQGALADHGRVADEPRGQFEREGGLGGSTATAVLIPPPL